MLLIVIPAYNEERNIERLLKHLKKLEKVFSYRAIIIVDDGSGDKTVDIISSYKSRLPVSLFTLSSNSGPGRAFEVGLSEALKLADKSDVICTMEADTTSDLSILPQMLGQITYGSDVVLASCYSPHGGDVVGTSKDRKILSFVANFLLRTFFPIVGIYTYSSFYRLYRPSALVRLKEMRPKLFTESGFVCMVELLIQLGRLPIQITEVPMILKGSRRLGSSKMKIVKTIFAYLRVIVRCSFSNSAPMKANQTV